MAKTKQAMNPQQTRESMEECIKLAKKEEAHIIAILDQLQRVISKTEENEVRKQQLPKNTQVCAKVRDPSSGEPMWILAKVVRGNASLDEYEIEDADQGDDDHEGHKSYVVRKKDLVLIPKSFSQHLGFDKGDRVLAMYPDTTCFYPGRIAEVDGKNYTLFFDDDEDDSGRTPRRKVSYKYVVPMG